MRERVIASHFTLNGFLLIWQAKVATRVPWAVGVGGDPVCLCWCHDSNNMAMALSLPPASKLVLFVLGPVALGEEESDLGHWGMILGSSVTLSPFYFIVHMCSWSTSALKGLVGILLAHCPLFVIGVDVNR